MVKTDLADDLFRISPIPTSILKPNGPYFTIFRVNEAYLRMTGRLESELIGQPLFSAFPPNPNEKKPHGSTLLHESLDRVVGERRSDELPVIRYDIIKEGLDYSEKYWKVINTPLLGEDDSVEFIINTASEVTDQRLSERENTLMINHTEDSFILIDRDLKVLNYNNLFARNYKELFNIDVEKGVSILEYTSPDRHEIVSGIYKRVFKGEIVESSLTIPTPDGRMRHFSLRYKPARDEYNTIIGSFVSILEVTEREEAIKKLEVNEKRYRALVENGMDAVALINENLEPFYVSASIQNVLGYNEEDIIGANISDLIHPEDLSKVSEVVKKALENPGKTVNGYTSRMKNKEGQWRWIEATVINMLHDPDIEGIIDNFRDVTDQVNYDRDLKNSLAEKETLLAEIHHRVKNNLAVVSGMMQLQAFEAEQQELKDQLHDSAGRIKTMATVHELLYQSGSFSKLDFSTTVKSLSESISQTLSIETEVKINLQIDPIELNINQAIPASLIVNEVITNVFKHAFKNQEKGTMDIGLEKTGDLVKILIKDNGSGLPESVLSSTRKSTLGLHLIDLLSKQIHGLYDYKSSDNGTLFELTFRKADFKSGIGSSRIR